jgi:hypothetical protein
MYLCCRILILKKDGKKAGRVLHGTRSFATEDESLVGLWRRSIRDVTIPDDEQWEKTIEDVFTRAGYRVIR